MTVFVFIRKADVQLPVPRVLALNVQPVGKVDLPLLFFQAVGDQVGKNADAHIAVGGLIHALKPPAGGKLHQRLFLPVPGHGDAVFFHFQRDMTALAGFRVRLGIFETPAAALPAQIAGGEQLDHVLGNIPVFHASHNRHNDILSHLQILPLLFLIIS